MLDWDNGKYPHGKTMRYLQFWKGFCKKSLKWHTRTLTLNPHCWKLTKYGATCFFAKFQLCVLERSDVTDTDWILRRKIKPISFSSLQNNQAKGPHLCQSSECEVLTLLRDIQRAPTGRRGTLSAPKGKFTGWVDFRKGWHRVRREEGMRLVYWLLDIAKFDQAQIVLGNTRRDHLTSVKSIRHLI